MKPSTPRRRGGRSAAPAQAAPAAPAAQPTARPDKAPGTDPVAQAAAVVRAAYDALLDAQGQVAVATAQLDEARAAAPRLSPRLAAAADAVDAARSAQATADASLDAADRVLADRDGAVRVAEAKLEELNTSTQAVGVGQLVAAEERQAKAVRDRAAAAEELSAARRVAQRSEQELTAAQEHLEQVRADPGPGPASVVSADTKLAKLRRAQAAAEGAYADAQQAHRQVAADAAKGNPLAGPRLQHFQSLEEFVSDYVLENWERDNGSTHTDLRWCAKWWEHPEAITRLEHVWEAFEAARREPPPAMSSWWRDHLDHHMARLTDPRGPFEHCDHTTGTHRCLPPWNADPAPDGLFEDTFESETAIERAKVRDIADQRAAHHAAVAEVPVDAAAEHPNTDQTTPIPTEGVGA
ncbi:DUF4913 domain-containing protein [Rudaeicoccus suwonensis]|uniref:Uncharacterized protein DUF4913 n=1 Tax=Rudaeicoccus suwonensis TaxID=657409 RepID=A0A561DVI9_9MICO|nr:DUF4913 domain-containing protein [Rudaeicoccus suwonensis]TWE07375.1 uncharacterized protein DUF4913 [Rudaeicoccus suwonensis]